MNNSTANNYKVEFNDENYIGEIKKYINISSRKKKISIYSLVISIILLALLLMPSININKITNIIEILLIGSIIIFIFNFANYLSYRSVIKLMEKNVICRGNNNYYTIE
ncbi:MAG: hypothetical protein HUJ77_09180 [Clostridium sp.]|uniref:hypothetical protein n=1 Tax=Clostridium sp. TaxID=1506 RepID=UPI0025C2B81B|nr:hypothetical protein [Clostridium sp.]MCF0148556.1 hypothetical protein [Clostridium sp.]